MKLIIDIPKSILEQLKSLDEECYYMEGWNIVTALLNGIPFGEEENKGLWRNYQGTITCEKCGEEVEEMTPFCPYCGEYKCQ